MYARQTLTELSDVDGIQVRQQTAGISVELLKQRPELHEHLPRAGQEDIAKVESHDQFVLLERIGRRLGQELVVLQLILLPNIGEQRVHQVIALGKVILQVSETKSGLRG